jgi:hypothetical protein
MYSPGSAIKPLQPLQPRLAEIIKILEMQGTLGCCKTVAYLLDMDSETREKLNENIDQILARQKEKGHIIPLSFFGGVALTAFCEQNKISSRDETWKREYVLATIFRTKDPERLMVTIFFDESDKIHDVQFCFLSLTDIPEDRMPSIEARSEKQKNNFLRHHLAEQSNKKIGRNEMCPCASGKKYKRCCGR